MSSVGHATGFSNISERNAFTSIGEIPTVRGKLNTARTAKSMAKKRNLLKIN
jgi:hypothetical protein